MNKPPVGSHLPIPTATLAAPPLIVWAWGNNNASQLGNATHSFGLAPAPVNGPANAPQFLDVTAISAGFEHALALKRDGTLWAWGQNTSGRLGDGTRTERPSPIQVHGDGGNGFLTGIVAIAAADGHSLAVDTLGQVWAWGDNVDGQLGDGTFAGRAFPARVHGAGGTGFLTGVVSVAGGSAHSVALKSDGTVWAWGLGVSGQLGNGQFVSSIPPGIATPVQVHAPTGSGFLNNVAGVAAGNSHSLLVNRAIVSVGVHDGDELRGTFGRRHAHVAQCARPCHEPWRRRCARRGRRSLAQRCAAERRHGAGLGRQLRRATRRWEHRGPCDGRGRARPGAAAVARIDHGDLVDPESVSWR